MNGKPLAVVRSSDGVYVHTLDSTRTKISMIKVSSVEGDPRGSPYFEDGKLIYRELPAMEGDAVILVYILKFIMNFFNFFNPFQEPKGYSKGGLVILGNHQYHLISEGECCWKAIDITSGKVDPSLEVRFYAAGFYMHWIVAWVYINLWHFMVFCGVESFGPMVVPSAISSRNIKTVTDDFEGVKAILIESIMEPECLELIAKLCAAGRPISTEAVDNVTAYLLKKIETDEYLKSQIDSVKALVRDTLAAMTIPVADASATVKKLQ